MKLICEYYNGRKKSVTITRTIHGYCNGCKKPTTITRLICKYCNGCKKPATIIKPICEYCIFEMALWKVYKHCTMFILIFKNPRQINVTYSYGPI